MTRNEAIETYRAAHSHYNVIANRNLSLPEFNDVCRLYGAECVGEKIPAQWILAANDAIEDAHEGRSKHLNEMLAGSREHLNEGLDGMGWICSEDSLRSAIADDEKTLAEIDGYCRNWQAIYRARF